MRVAIFCHSLISDWNHGNAHFLRGISTELIARGHDVATYEAADSWSLTHLLADAGSMAITRFYRAFPTLCPHLVDFDRLALDEVLSDVDLVLVHEWNPPALIERIGRHRARGGRYRLLFHDTHHRSVTDVDAMSRCDLDAYDGVLAFGEVIRERYVTLGWSRRAWTWHEAADVRTFTPLTPPEPERGPALERDAEREAGVDRDRQRDLIWIGNWGDDERSAELRSHLIAPVRQLGLRATVHGVRYPDEALQELQAAGISYGGWIANYDAPAAYARHRMTVHIPRRPYVEALPGIPTIRVFEALACGIPLVSMPWPDVEGLFTSGDDFLVASDACDMREKLRALRDDAELRAAIAAHGLATIQRRHTCAHRVDELLAILGQLGQDTSEAPPQTAETSRRRVAALR